MPYVMIAMIPIFVILGIALWHGKCTFLISGYKKYDKEKTNLQKLHRINALECFTVSLGFIIMNIGWYINIRAVMWGGILLMAILYAIFIIYEKTGNHFSKYKATV